MGSIIGKESVAEPPFKVLLQRATTNQVKTHYEIREYGTRYAAQVEYSASGSGSSGSNDANTPFRALAQYIGVFGEAQNQGTQSMAMTAPVAMETTTTTPTQGIKMAMTAPVAMETTTKPQKLAMTAPVAMESNNNSNDKNKVMKFFLPAEYDAMDKIPIPTNPQVHIAEIPPAVGAVHRYSGSYDDQHNQAAALELAAQLRHDGVNRMTDDYVLGAYQFWGYNPPFCIPAFRRNEIWLELTLEEVENLQKEDN